jgi:DNA-binding CsgD family transcriptional regulator/tetratricopeptide (TPR) repeat protein
MSEIGAGARARGAEWPLVGRADELAEIVATLADGDVGGMILVGAAGVGKTRIAREATVVAATRGMTPLTITATRVLQPVPFGAFAPEIVPNESTSRADAVHEICRELATRTGGTRLVLLVDDAQWLDDFSAVVVRYLCAQRIAFVIATRRDDEIEPEPIVATWTDGDILRMDVPPLAGTAIEQLLAFALGGPVDPVTSRAFAVAAAGSPLLLRELVNAAREQRLLEVRHGLWVLSGALSHAPRLRDVLATRFSGLDPAARELMELLALGEPLALPVVETLVGPAALDAAEAAGLIRVEVDGPAREVRLMHPLYADVIRSALPARRSAAHARRLVDAHAGTDANAAVLEFRMMIWRVEAGQVLTSGDAVSGAWRALNAHDANLAIRITSAATGARPTPALEQVLGEALRQLGRADEAESVLGSMSAFTDAAGPSDETVAFHAFSRAENLFFGLGRIDEAYDVLRRAVARVEDGELRAELVAHLSVFDTFCGRLGAAVADIEEFLLVPHGRGFLEAATAAVPALAIMGETERAAGIARDAFAARLAIADEARMAEAAIHLVTGAHALAEAGRLEEADGIARFGFEHALNNRIPLGVGWFGLELGRVQLLRGVPVSALLSFRAAANGFAEIGLRPQVWWACGGALFAAATTGDPTEIAAALEALDECEAHSVVFMRPDVLRARANAAAASGLRSAASDYLAEALDLARTTEQHTLAHGVIHDIARIDDAQRAVALLDAYPMMPDGALAPARARFVRARARHRGHELVTAADAFERCGALLYAAEAFATASRVLRDSGSTRDATDAAAATRRVLAACESSRTPPLASRSPVDLLSRREREVAALAASGLTSRAIGQRLSIAERTVENHLQRAFTKLGVGSRAELGIALEIEHTAS